MSDYPYVQIAEDPPGKKLGHYKLRRPPTFEPTTSELDALIKRLTAEIDDKILYGSSK